jgi:Zn-dependent protease
MINKREILIISLIILIIGFSLNLSLNFFEEWKTVLYTLLSVAILILINIFTKKVVAYRLDSEIEMRVWEVGKYGFTKDKHSKKPFPLGAFLPIISKIILFPLKSFVWMASMVFDVKPRIYRGAKRFGLYTFSEITEYHLGLIAASGIAINLILSVIGYLLGFPLFARLNIYYAFFNMIPISDLDGNKIFFGNLILWAFLASLTLIGMLFAIFII